MGRHLVRTVGEMRLIIAPALAEILTPQECAATRLRVLHRAGYSMADRARWPERGDTDRLDEMTLLDYVVFDDRGGSWMHDIETAPEMYSRFRSELQDFVAESRFGWGQWRP